MGRVDNQLLEKGYALESNLRQEGREQDADTIHSLITIAEQDLAQGKYLTTGQTAARLGVSRQTIVNWVNRGLMPGVRMGGRLIVPLTAFERFAPLEALLDTLDEEHPPLSPQEAARVVAEGRGEWHWQEREE